MTSETLKWAAGLRASLVADIDAALAEGIKDSLDAAKLVTLRQHLQRMDSMLAALHGPVLDPADFTFP